MMIDLTTQECEDILKQNHYAHLGCIDGEEPYVVPITYLYRDGFLYGISMPGHKIDLLRKNKRMCVQVEHVVNNEDWKSVMCWGFFEEITDEKSMQEIKLLLGEELGQVVLQEGKQPVSALIKDLHATKNTHGIVYRMQPYRVTGKSEKHS